MAKAFEVKVGNAIRKLVLIKLADNANDQGYCWPSFLHIAEQCEVSRRSVINHVDALQAMGLVEVTHRKTEKGSSSNLYRVCLESSAGNAPLENKGLKDSGLNKIVGGENPAPLDSVSRIPSEFPAPLTKKTPLPSAARSLPSESPALGGSAGAAPRISHSFESVIEPAAVGEQSPVLVTDLPPAQHDIFKTSLPDHKKHFPMSMDWQPSANLAGLCQFNMVDLAAMDPSEQDDILREFITYWITRGDRPATQSEWDRRFMQQLKRIQAQRTETTNQSARGSVTEAVMDINNLDWTDPNYKVSAAVKRGKRAEVSAALMNIKDTSW
jgi:hypothetical protein